MAAGDLGSPQRIADTAATASFLEGAFNLGLDIASMMGPEGFILASLLRTSPTVRVSPPRVGFQVNQADVRALRLALNTLEKSLAKELTKELRVAAEPIRSEAAARFVVVDPRSAGKYGISVRKTGMISVEQRLRKSADVRRRRRNFGPLQMKVALTPALQANQSEVVGHVDDAVRSSLRRAGF